MRAIHTWIVALTAGLVFVTTSCQRPEAVEFKSIKNTKIIKISSKSILFDAEAHFYNPNNVGGQIREVAVDVLYEGRKVAELKRDNEQLQIAKNSEFVVPLKLSISLKQIGKSLLGGLVSLARDNELELNYVGYAQVKVYGLNYKVPINYVGVLVIK